MGELHCYRFSKRKLGRFDCILLYSSSTPTYPERMDARQHQSNVNDKSRAVQQQGSSTYRYCCSSGVSFGKAVDEITVLSTVNGYIISYIILILPYSSNTCIWSIKITPTRSTSFPPPFPHWYSFFRSFFPCLLCSIIHTLLLYYCCTAVIVSARCGIYIIRSKCMKISSGCVVQWRYI